MDQQTAPTVRIRTGKTYGRAAPGRGIGVPAVARQPGSIRCGYCIPAPQEPKALPQAPHGDSQATGSDEVPDSGAKADSFFTTWISPHPGQGGLPSPSRINCSNWLPHSGQAYS